MPCNAGITLALGGYPFADGLPDILMDGWVTSETHLKVMQQPAGEVGWPPPVEEEDDDRESWEEFPDPDDIDWQGAPDGV